LKDKIQMIVDTMAEQSLRQAFDEHPEHKEKMKQRFKGYDVEEISDELLFESFKNFTKIVMGYLQAALPGMLRSKN